MSHFRMSHVTHMNESCHTYEWVMTRIWMSHVTRADESLYIYDWDMSLFRIRPITYIDESCHTYGWVTWHIWMSLFTHMSHVTRMNESRHTHTSVVPHVRISHVTQALQNILTYIYISCPHKWIIEYHIELNYARANQSCLAGTKALQKIGTMSGGEKARVALSMFVLVPHNLLILGGL